MNDQATNSSVPSSSAEFDTDLLKQIEFVNIGAGITRLDDAINVDIADKADVTVDLGVDRLPFDDDSVDLIFSDHTIEHVENYLFLISEINRILKPGGCFLVGVPYLTLTQYNLVNPYHLHNFNEFSFDFFDPTKMRGSAAEEVRLDLRKLSHVFEYIGVFRYLPFIRSIARRHLFNVVREIKFAVTKGEAPTDLTTQIADNLPAVYTAIATMRKRY